MFFSLQCNFQSSSSSLVLPNNVIRAVFELQNDASAGLRFLRHVYQIYHIQRLTRRNGIVGKAPHQRVIALGARREERSIIVFSVPVGCETIHVIGLGGKRPARIIRHSGLHAEVNALGIGIDAAEVVLAKCSLQSGSRKQQH